MATTPEGKVKNKIKDLLKSYGDSIYYFMPAMGAFGKSGVPDIVCCVDGLFLAIEVKADARKNPPTPLQVKNLAEIRSAGGASFTIDANDMDFLRGFIDGMIEQRAQSRKIVTDLLARFM